MVESYSVATVGALTECFACIPASHMFTGSIDFMANEVDIVYPLSTICKSQQRLVQTFEVLAGPISTTSARAMCSAAVHHSRQNAEKPESV